MAEHGDRLVVLFDRDCAFCGWVARQLNGLDRGRRLFLMPLQEATDHSARPELARVAQTHPLGEMLHVVSPDGSVRAGGDALIEIFRLLPGGALVRLWSRLPGARPLADFVYGLTARNRATLGRLVQAAGANCELPTHRPNRQKAASSRASDTSAHRGPGRGGGTA